MTIAGFIPLLVAVISGVVYLATSSAGIKELSRLTFHAAMIASMIALIGHTARLP